MGVQVYPLQRLMKSNKSDSIASHNLYLFMCIPGDITNDTHTLFIYSGGRWVTSSPLKGSECQYPPMFLCFLKHLSKTIFLLSSSHIILNMTPTLQTWGCAKSNHLLYVSHAPFKDDPILSHSLLIPFRFHLLPFSPHQATLFSLHHLMKTMHFILRCCFLVIQWVTHSTTSFIIPYWENKVHTSLWICLNNVKL